MFLWFFGPSSYAKSNSTCYTNYIKGDSMCSQRVPLGCRRLVSDSLDSLSEFESG